MPESSQASTGPVSYDGVIDEGEHRAPSTLTGQSTLVRDDSATSPPLKIHVGMALRDAEQLLIEATLAAHPDKTHAASLLGISKKTLYDRLRLYEAVRAAVARELARTA